MVASRSQAQAAASLHERGAARISDMGLLVLNESRGVIPKVRLTDFMSIQRRRYSQGMHWTGDNTLD